MLYVVALLVFVLLSYYLPRIFSTLNIQAKKSSGQKNEPVSSSDDDSYSTSKKVYFRKNTLFNSSEHAFFINLENTLGKDFIILSKVRMEDFIEVPAGMFSQNERFSHRNRIKSRHVDYLVCRRRDSAPVLAIELDGKSHHEHVRQERDDFVDRVYKMAGLPFIHVKVGEDFAKYSNKIYEILQKIR